MKQLFLALASITFLLIGCSSTNNADEMITCETSQKAYIAYQTLLASGAVDIDPQTVAYVKLAASFLSMYCGWTPETVAVATAKSVKLNPVFDSNGVPILRKP